MWWLFLTTAMARDIKRVQTMVQVVWNVGVLNLDLDQDGTSTLDLHHQ